MIDQVGGPNAGKRLTPKTIAKRSRYSATSLAYRHHASTGSDGLSPAVPEWPIREHRLAAFGQFPRSQLRRRAPDQVGRDHQRIETPGMTLRGHQTFGSPHPAGIARRPDREAARETATERHLSLRSAEQRPGRGAEGEVRSEREVFSRRFPAWSSDYFGDLAGRQRIAFIGGQTAVHAAHRRCHGRSTHEAGDGAYQEAARKRLMGRGAFALRAHRLNDRRTDVRFPGAS